LTPGVRGTDGISTRFTTTATKDAAHDIIGTVNWRTIHPLEQQTRRTTHGEESRLNRLILHNRTEVLPALHSRSIAPAQAVQRPAAKLTYQQRTTRTRRFPVEQSLDNAPPSAWLGRYLDVEV
jgi:hypothetical protein